MVPGPGAYTLASTLKGARKTFSVVGNETDLTAASHTRSRPGSVSPSRILTPQIREMLLTDKVSYGDGPGCFEGPVVLDKKTVGGTMGDALRKVKGVNEVRDD